MLKDKHITIGVTGGIAIYKMLSLVSRLVKEGADVHVVMTENAQKFVSPLLFETISKNRVITDTFNRDDPKEVDHISLAKLSDLVLVAPATANIIAKAANGIADDFLSTMLLAVTGKKAFAPAMNTNMLNAAPTQRNIETLRNDGAYIIDSATGMLACGDVGSGRLPEPDELYEHVLYLLSDKDLEGKKVLVTAGPTVEMIDDVRYLTNRSTGKMGYAIARAAALRGADVTLVSGPTSLSVPMYVNRVDVKSASDMYEACVKAFPETDITIKAAAVADYTPAEYREGKIKKAGDMDLQLVRTKDVLKELGSMKKDGQVLIGFAAEASDIENNALGKLEKKNLDAIAANDISRSDAGFGTDTNEVTMYFRDGTRKNFEKADKFEIANRLLDEALRILA